MSTQRSGLGCLGCFGILILTLLVAAVIGAAHNGSGLLLLLGVLAAVVGLGVYQGLKRS